MTARRRPPGVIQLIQGITSLGSRFRMPGGSALLKHETALCPVQLTHLAISCLLVSGWRLCRHFGRDVVGRDDLSGRGRGDDRTVEGAVGLHDDLAGAVHVPPQVVIEHGGQAARRE